jgi:chemotaxis protein MotA
VDWGSLIGIALAIGGLLFGQLLEGGKLGSLIQPAAFIIVVIGTIGAVILQSGMKNFTRGVKMAGLVFMPKQDNYPALIRDIASWSVIARREGLLSLERVISGVSDPFIQHGLRLIVDGVDPARCATSSIWKFPPTKRSSVSPSRYGRPPAAMRRRSAF